MCNFITKNNLWSIIILYIIYNFSSMNFYNIIENNYIEKKQMGFLIHNYNLYLLIIFIYGFTMGSINLYSLISINFKKYYIFLILMIINMDLVIFYALNLFKNYYNYYKKKTI